MPGNTHAYVNGNPVNLSDPDGHQPQACLGDGYCRASAVALHAGDQQAVAAAYPMQERHFMEFAATGTRTFTNILYPSAQVFYNLPRQISAAPDEVAQEIRDDAQLGLLERIRFRNLTACAAFGGDVHDYCSSNGHTTTIPGLASGSFDSTEIAARLLAEWEIGGAVSRVVGDTLVAALGGTFTRFGADAGTLPVVGGALAKIASLTDRYGAGIEHAVLTTGTRYVDTASGGNINVFAPRPDSAGFIRITLDPTGSRIISAGLNQYGNVVNGIENGRFVRVP